MCLVAIATEYPTDRPSQPLQRHSQRCFTTSSLTDCPLEVLFQICPHISDVHDLRNLVLSSYSITRRLQEFVYVLSDVSKNNESMIPKELVSRFHRLSHIDEIPSFAICIRECSLSMSIPPMPIPMAIEEQLHRLLKPNTTMFLIIREVLGMKPSQDRNSAYMLVEVPLNPGVTSDLSLVKNASAEANEDDPVRGVLKALFMLKAVETRTVRIVPPSLPSSTMQYFMDTFGQSDEPSFKFSECQTAANVKFFV